MFDIEGPLPDSASVKFVIGARATSNNTYDLNIGAQIAAAVILNETAPAMFSACVLKCLENLYVDSPDTSIVSLGFDESARELRLLGAALDSEYQEVIRTMKYINSAPSPTITGFSIELYDGVASTEAELSVTTVPNSMRRRRQAREVHIQKRVGYRDGVRRRNADLSMLDHADDQNHQNLDQKRHSGDQKRLSDIHHEIRDKIKRNSVNVASDGSSNHPMPLVLIAASLALVLLSAAVVVAVWSLKSGQKCKKIRNMTLDP